jgi:hypothetical protein
MAVTGGITAYLGPSPDLTETWTTGAAVTAGHVVRASGDQTCVETGAAALDAVGIATQTSDAVGDKIGVARDGVYDLPSSGAITAGSRVGCAAGGLVSAIAADGDPRLIIGIAIKAASGNVCRVRLTL